MPPAGIAPVERAKAEAEVGLVTQIRLAGKDNWSASAWLLARRFPTRLGTQRQGKRWGVGRSKTRNGDEAKGRLNLRRLTPTELREIRGRAGQSG